MTCLARLSLRSVFPTLPFRYLFPVPCPCPSLLQSRHPLTVIVRNTPRTFTTSTIFRNDCHISLISVVLLYIDLRPVSLPSFPQASHHLRQPLARARDSDSVSICWMDDVCGVDAVVWEPSVIVVETLDYLVYWIQRECEIALPDDCSYARSSFKVALDARFCGVVLDSSGPTVQSGCTSFTSVGLLSHLSLVLLQDHRGGKPKICASGRGQRR